MFCRPVLSQLSSTSDARHTHAKRHRVAGVSRSVSGSRLSDGDGDGHPERRATVSVTEYSDYGSVDVQRPEEIGGPGLAELIWDVAHY